MRRGWIWFSEFCCAWVLTGAQVPTEINSKECWVGGWTPEICCSAPGAKGNPLCWDHVYTYDKCCTDTQEGRDFNIRRANFVSDMVRKGATVYFDIRHVSGGRTGAVSDRTLASRETILRVPASQVYSMKSVPASISSAAEQKACDPHATLALGLLAEKLNPGSALQDWIKLLPTSFANVLWFSDSQLRLVNSTFFNYLVQNWFHDLECMQQVALAAPKSSWRSRDWTITDLKWALSVVKTRGFAFEGTRESTMLIPLADFLNHHTRANVRTATYAEDALRFVATRNVLPGEELCIEYAQASNLEFMIRYGFRVEDNPYGGRQFDLAGEPMQAHCPSYILRYDLGEIINNETVDCHRQARYLSFEQQFGSMTPQETLQEDRYIFRAIEEACVQLLQMLQTTSPLSSYETEMAGDGRGVAPSHGNNNGITAVLVREIRTERVLLQRCAAEFQQRQLETASRPIQGKLAESLQQIQRGPMPGNSAAEEVQQRAPPPRTSSFGESPGGGGPGVLDRSRIDRLLERLQSGGI